MRKTLFTRRTAGALLACCTGLISAPALAQPANNACGANTASFTVPSAGGTVTGNAAGATRDGAACTGSTGIDVYHYFTPNTTGAWSLATCSTSPSWDTVLSIHSNTCPVSNTTSLACNDDGCSPLSSISTVNLTAGTQYIIRVASFSSSSSGIGAYTLVVTNLSVTGACCNSSTAACSITTAAACTTGSTFQGANTTCSIVCPQGACCTAGACTITGPSGCSSSNQTYLGTGTSCSPNNCPQPPANDECAGAITINTVNAAATVTGTTLGATTTSGATSSCGNSGANDVWYLLIPDQSTNYTASLCNSSPAWDSVLSVHTACPGTSANQIASSACNDDGCSGGIGLSAITTSFPLTAGTQYYVRVAGYPTSVGGAQIRGNFVLSIAGQPLGRCCAADGSTCSVVTLANCTGTNVWTEATLCNVACPQPQGSCCAANGACTTGAQSACTTGTWTLNGTCSPNICTQPAGACCDPAGACTEVNGVDACTALSGTFTIGGTCSPNPCPQPPANDDCPGTALTLGTTVNGSLALANGSALTGFCTGSTRDVYYSFTNNGPSGTFQITVTPLTGTFGVATVVSPECPMTTSSAALACTGQTATVFSPTVAVTNGQTIYVRVADFAEGNTFSIGIVDAGPSGACCNLASGACTVTNQSGCTQTFTTGAVCDTTICPVPPPPANDACSGAIALSLGTAFNGNNALATSTSDGIASTCQANVKNGVWFSFNPGAFGGDFQISTCTSGQDTVLSVFSSDCTGIDTAGNILVCNDDGGPACTGTASSLNATLNANTNYLVRLQTWGSGTAGNYTIIVTNRATGSCCNGTVCTNTFDATSCGAGTFTAGGVCSASSCAPAGGVCCRGVTCTTGLTAGTCTSVNSNGTTIAASFVAASDTCNAAGVLTQPCCYGNFDRSADGVQVADIFAFLSAFFANSPYAVQQSTTGGADPVGTPGVPDIFNFLSSWFGAGGCV